LFCITVFLTILKGVHDPSGLDLKPQDPARPSSSFHIFVCLISLLFCFCYLPLSLLFLYFYIFLHMCIATLVSNLLQMVAILCQHLLFQQHLACYSCFSSYVQPLFFFCCPTLLLFLSDIN